MSILPRKLTFQLTPLLDLLLIVIFAQYLEVQHTAAEYESEIQQRAATQVATLKQQADAELAALRALQAEAADKSSRHEQQVADLEEEAMALRERLRQQEVELTEALKQAIEQRDLVGRLTVELFQAPAETVKRIIQPANGAEGGRSPEELARLEQQFRELGRQQADEMVKHLLTFEELRKRCDIWEIYLDDQGLVTFTTGQQSYEFRAATAEAFAAQLYQRYKALPQPKSLVIILLSYGKAKAVWREAAMNGLRDAADRMRVDSNGRSRFEYAILGYRPRGLTNDNATGIEGVGR